MATDVDQPEAESGGTSEGGGRPGQDARPVDSQLFQSLPAAAYACDAGGRIRAFNRAAASLWGREPVLGQDVWCGSLRLHHPEGGVLPPDRFPMALALKEGRPLRGVEVVIERPDGSRRHVLANPDPLFDGRGVVVGGINLLVDISEHKRAEQEAERRKNDFLATLAHELRNPLAPIRNSLEVLRLAGGEPPTPAICAILDRQVNHMVRLLDDLLDVSRITRGLIVIRPERIDLASVLRTALEASQPLIDAAHHEITIVLPPGPLPVDADVIRLAQVFTNLLNNAARYTARGGHVVLTASRQEGQAVISVRDDGAGIPASMLPRVFDLFDQSDDDALGRTRGGLGIGLMMVRRLVAMHGGMVEARSGGVGRGSEFIVRLPLADDPRPAAVRRMGGPRPEPGSGPLARRVLVVDDNRDAADSLGMLLRLLGADVLIVNDGPSALAAMRPFAPDVVLMDIGMPGMDGYEVARRIRAPPDGSRDDAPGTAPALLVALTGWGTPDDRRRSDEAGFDQHLVKPVDAGVLRTLLTSCADSGTWRPASR